MIVQTPPFTCMGTEVQTGSVELTYRVTGPGQRCWGTAGVSRRSSPMTGIYPFVTCSKSRLNFRVTSVSSNAWESTPSFSLLCSLWRMGLILSLNVWWYSCLKQAGLGAFLEMYVFIHNFSFPWPLIYYIYLKNFPLG